MTGTSFNLLEVGQNEHHHDNTRCARTNVSTHHHACGARDSHWVRRTYLGDLHIALDIDAHQVQSKHHSDGINDAVDRADFVEMDVVKVDTMHAGLRLGQVRECLQRYRFDGWGQP